MSWCAGGLQVVEGHKDEASDNGAGQAFCVFRTSPKEDVLKVQKGLALLGLSEPWDSVTG